MRLKILKESHDFTIGDEDFRDVTIILSHGKSLQKILQKCIFFENAKNGAILYSLISNLILI